MHALCGSGCNHPIRALRSHRLERSARARPSGREAALRRRDPRESRGWWFLRTDDTARRVVRELRGLVFALIEDWPTERETRALFVERGFEIIAHERAFPTGAPLAYRAVESWDASSPRRSTKRSTSNLRCIKFGASRNGKKKINRRDEEDAENALSAMLVQAKGFGKREEICSRLAVTSRSKESDIVRGFVVFRESSPANWCSSRWASGTL